MRSDDGAAMRPDRDGPVPEFLAASSAAPDLAVGDRVRMSALGQDRHPRYGDRQGVIVRKAAASAWRIRFDGLNSLQTIHRDYLEKVVSGTERAPRD